MEMQFAAEHAGVCSPLIEVYNFLTTDNLTTRLVSVLIYFVLDSLLDESVTVCLK